MKQIARLPRMSCHLTKHLIRYMISPRIRPLAAHFFSTPGGREPVREWLRSLPVEARRLIGADIQYVQFKWPIGRPRVAHVHDGVWEIRTSIDDRIARTLFAVVNERIIILHGFIKKSQTLPLKELRLAARRLKEFLDGET